MVVAFRENMVSKKNGVIFLLTLNKSCIGINKMEITMENVDCFKLVNRNVIRCFSGLCCYLCLYPLRLIKMLNFDESNYYVVGMCFHN